jgi:SAM-dependent methyltransferase
MDNYQETAKTWNKMASLYEEKFMHLDLYNETYDAILATIPKQNAKVLEIGCGPGNIAKYLLTKRPYLDYFGTDIAPKMVELAKKNIPNARFALLDSRNLGVLKDRFDAIVCGFCLPYITSKDLPKFLSDCANKLNSKGILYISFVEGDPKDSNFKTNNTCDRVFFNYYKLNELKKELLACGLKDVSVLFVDFPRGEDVVEKHSILLARK